MVRSRKGIEMLVNLINISYCVRKLLPYQDRHFSKYRGKSVPEFRFVLSEGIRRQIFFATFVQNIETRIKSNGLINGFKTADSFRKNVLYKVVKWCNKYKKSFSNSEVK